MTLEDWAAIAEIVGALAVVLTLVYLAVQVKHSKGALDAKVLSTQIPRRFAAK